MLLYPGLRSSFAGTDSTNLTDGYVASVGSGGQTRLDLVTVTAVPSAPVPEIDPAGMGSVLALVTGGLGLLERRRRRA